MCDRSAAAARVTGAAGEVGSSRRNTSAAAPSLGEHSMKRCRGSQTTREASTSSTDVSFWYMASGLDAPWRRFFTTTRARWSLVTPDVRASRWARRAKNDGVVLPGADGRGRQHQRGAAAGAAGFDVDDGHAGHAEAAQDLVPRRHAA